MMTHYKHKNLWKENDISTRWHCDTCDVNYIDFENQCISLSQELVIYGDKDEFFNNCHICTSCKETEIYKKLCDYEVETKLANIEL